MKISELLYAYIGKFPFARSLVNRIILMIIPSSVRINNAIVMLNTKDPVISGALTFGVYEKTEIALMQRICKPGYVMLDIGANIGLYTAIAGCNIGPYGRVISFEPDPESYHYLKKTVAANKLTNVTLVQAAASFGNGKTLLFTSSNNRGDHRLYGNDHADGQLEIQTLRIDDYLEEQNLSVIDVIKIDVQGFEAHVISGMKKTIQSSPCLIMLMEFWPEGLTLAGSDPHQLLDQLESLGLTLYEIKNVNHFIRLENKRKLINKLQGREYANLLLLGPQTDFKV